MKSRYPEIEELVGNFMSLGLRSGTGFLATFFFGFLTTTFFFGFLTTFLTTFFFGFLTAFFTVVFLVVVVLRLGFVVVVVAYPRDAASARRAAAMELTSTGFATAA